MIDYTSKGYESLPSNLTMIRARSVYRPSEKKVLTNADTETILAFAQVIEYPINKRISHSKGTEKFLITTHLTSQPVSVKLS